MKANEIRLGNYIKNKIGITFEVTQIDNSGFAVNDNRVIWENHDYFEPIPLTEEWILKFGYKQIDDANFVLKGHLIWVPNDFIMCDKCGIILRSVHQLQNLYFALTGEELTIKN